MWNLSVDKYMHKYRLKPVFHKWSTQNLEYFKAGCHGQGKFREHSILFKVRKKPASFVSDLYYSAMRQMIGVSISMFVCRKYTLWTYIVIDTYMLQYLIFSQIFFSSNILAVAFDMHTCFWWSIYSIQNSSVILEREKRYGSWEMRCISLEMRLERW